MQVVREHRDDLVGRVRVLTIVVTTLLVMIATVVQVRRRVVTAQPAPAGGE